MTPASINMMNLRYPTILGRRGTMVGRSVGRSVGWLCEIDKKFIVLCQRSTSTSQRGRGAARRYLWRTSAASSGAPHPRIEAAAQRRIDSGWLRFSGDRLRTDTVGSKMRCYDLPKYCAASSSPLMVHWLRTALARCLALSAVAVRYRPCTARPPARPGRAPGGRAARPRSRSGTRHQAR